MLRLGFSESDETSWSGVHNPFGASWFWESNASTKMESPRGRCAMSAVSDSSVSERIFRLWVGRMAEIGEGRFVVSPWSVNQQRAEFSRAQAAFRSCSDPAT